MDVFFSPTENRIIAAGLFAAIAGVLALIWVALSRRGYAQWPCLGSALLGMGIWQLTAVALLADGATTEGSVLTGLIITLVLAGSLTFLINEQFWTIAVGF